MTTYKLNAYRQILEIFYVCIYHHILKVLWIKYCLNQQTYIKESYNIQEIIDSRKEDLVHHQMLVMLFRSKLQTQRVLVSRQ